MTVNRATPEQLTELARGIACGDYLVVDGDNADWTLSLALIADSIIDAGDDLGLVLVPVGPHMGGYWINGRVPGVTVTCTFVAAGDVAELQERLNRMHDALYPQP